MSLGAVRIDWFPKDALEGMQLLEPWEELAYRRILDLLYVSGGEVEDDAVRLARFTKTGKRWPKIRQSLLDMGKLQARNGALLNPKATEVLKGVEKARNQRSGAGKASAARRKVLKNNETEATGADPPRQRKANETPTVNQRSQRASEPASQRKLASSADGDGQTCDPVALGREALRALGCDPDRVEANGGTYAPVSRWLAEGVTPAEIVAVFQRRTDLADKRNPVAYASKLMGDEVAKLRAEERVASGWHPPNPDQQRALWRARLEGFCRNGVWPQNIGPDPDSPHCDAPRDLIAEVRSEHGEGGS